jgi:hypothetical protein
MNELITVKNHLLYTRLGAKLLAINFIFVNKNEKIT